MVGGFYGMLLLSAKCPRPLADGKTPYERRFGESFKGPTIPSSALVEYLPNSERETKLEFINSERKYYQESFLDML